jgi:hypothetical protein
MEEQFLKELKELCNKYNVEISEKFDWGWNGEDEFRYFEGTYFESKDFSLKITEDLL